FMQCLVQGQECTVYDIGYRLTGTLEYKLMNEIYDFDPLEMMISFPLTGEMTEQPLDNLITPIWERYACNVSFLMKPGTIKEINGLEKIKKLPGVIDAVIAHDVGDTLPEEAKGMLRQIMLRVFATASNQVKLENILDEVYSTLQVISTNGEDMLLEGFNTEELKGELL